MSLTLSLFLLAFCISSTWCKPQYALENAETHFEDFIREYGKQYADENEKQHRFQIFKDNLEKVNQKNLRSGNVTYGITMFTDLTHDEFLNKYVGCLRGSDYHNSCTYSTDSDIQVVGAPESFDWRDKNVVTPVKNQDKCGSCYAFSSTGNIESQYAIKKGQQIILSEQQIVDCDSRDFGCSGGYMSNVFRSLIEQGGSVSENSYPYKGAESGSCKFDPSQVQAKLADCKSFSLTSQEKVKELLVSNGPLAVTVKASDFGQYHGGIMTDEHCTGEIDHAVLLVGYGTDNGVPYWIMKNSWATKWGEQGYFRVQRGEGADSCGFVNDMMATAVLV